MLRNLLGLSSLFVCSIAIAGGGVRPIYEQSGPESSGRGLEVSTREASTDDSELMTPSQKRVSEELTSIWENDTTELQYGYSENISDDRGYTSGRAGFCTGTGDAILVVQCFDKNFKGEHSLSKYLGELDRLNKIFEINWENVPDVSGLDAIGNYPADWARTDANPQTQKIFRSCQDQVVDELYYLPAMRGAKEYGLNFALSKAVFYDSYINHGEDGAREIAEYTNKLLGGTPAHGHTKLSEWIWLKVFLSKRKAILNSDPIWAESTGRVVNYEHLLWRGNVNLDRSFYTRKTSSGYTVYHIVP